MVKGIRRGALVVAMVGGLPLALGSCGKTDRSAPALSKSAAVVPQAPTFISSASPGVIPCGSTACPVTKSARKVCCNAPGVPPMCRSADRCGQASKFRYSGMLSCNETADCKGTDPGRDVVCCITDDGFRAEGVPGPYNRAGCVPRAACTGKDVLACTSDAECSQGTRCRAIPMGIGVEIGGCLP
ncbi:MAG: hypothetical protein RMJ98_20385 [Myxococcales bacterium]|nr:hypothetical protein [Polyangiaceae bacterium]MDW8251660.1 hypothetical protein [Myxococcales bacterium]